MTYRAMDNVVYDNEAAGRVCRFFENVVKHVKGAWAGQRFALSEWQADLLRRAFGTKRVDDGMRQYRTAYVEVPRKNGKSTLAAGIALYLLLYDNEPGAEVYSAAGDRKQAAIVFNTAKRMVELSPVLSRKCKVYRNTIKVPETDSIYQVLSSDARRQHGFSASGVIFDEVHVQKNRELWEALATSVGARAQPFIWAITTAGYDRTSLCWELHEHAAGVLAGRIEDPTFLASIFSSDKEYSSVEAWREANPNFGVSVSQEYLATACARAKAVPGFQNSFRRLHLNQWTEQETRWLDMDAWDKCDKGEATSSGSRKIYLGLDLSSTVDMTALAILTPPKSSSGDWLVEMHYWAPQEAVAKNPQYRFFADNGALTVTEGNVVDYAVVRKFLAALRSKHNIAEIAIDMWNGTQLATELTSDGFNVVSFGQGFASMTAPTKLLEMLVLSNSLNHFGHPILRYNASNVSVVQDDAGNLKPSRKASRLKIDGIVALIMALGRAAVGLKTSVYETRGMITV